MSHVIATPEIMTAAAADLATIGSMLEEAQRMAAPSILTMSPAAADEVSVGIAQLFLEHAQDYQTVASDVATYQDQLIQNLTASAVSYASAEDVIAALLRGLDSIGGLIFPALGLPTDSAALWALLVSFVPPEWGANLSLVFVVIGILVLLSPFIVVGLPAAVYLWLQDLFYPYLGSGGFPIAGPP